MGRKYSKLWLSFDKLEPPDSPVKMWWVTFYITRARIPSLDYEDAGVSIIYDKQDDEFHMRFSSKDYHDLLKRPILGYVVDRDLVARITKIRDNILLKEYDKVYFMVSLNTGYPYLFVTVGVFNRMVRTNFGTRYYYKVLPTGFVEVMSIIMDSIDSYIMMHYDVEKILRFKGS